MDQTKLLFEYYKVLGVLQCSEVDLLGTVGVGAGVLSLRSRIVVEVSLPVENYQIAVRFPLSL